MTRGPGGRGTPARRPPGWLALAVGCLLSGEAAAQPRGEAPDGGPGAAAIGNADAGPRVLFDQRSPYARVLVTEQGGERCLAFDDVTNGTQSCIDPADPGHVLLDYVRHISVAAVFVPDAQRGLMLGLGGGSIVQMLVPRMPRLRLDVVELDPVVVEATRLHFGVTDSPRVHIVTGDGRAYLAASRERWDLIVLDAFGEDYIPFSLTTVEFFRLVDAHLAPGGAVVTNLWNTNGAVFRAQLKTLRAVFPAVHVFDGEAWGNAIVVATRDARPWSREMVEQRARAVGPRFAWTFDFLETPKLYQPLAHYDLRTVPVFIDARPEAYRALSAGAASAP